MACNMKSIVNFNVLFTYALKYTGFYLKNIILPPISLTSHPV